MDFEPGTIIWNFGKWRNGGKTVQRNGRKTGRFKIMPMSEKENAFDPPLRLSQIFMKEY